MSLPTIQSRIADKVEAIHPRRPMGKQVAALQGLVNVLQGEGVVTAIRVVADNGGGKTKVAGTVVKPRVLPKGIDPLPLVDFAMSEAVRRYTGLKLVVTSTLSDGRKFDRNYG